MTKLETLGSDVSIIWFWAGLCILLGIAHIYRGSMRAFRRVDRIRGELETALAERRAAVRRIFPIDGELGRICRTVEAAMTPEEVFACEADLDMWIYRRHKTEAAAKSTDLQPVSALLESAALELRPFRDRYNEAATRVILLRRTFPAAIVARTIVTADPPLFPDPDFT